MCNQEGCSNEPLMCNDCVRKLLLDYREKLKVYVEENYGSRTDKIPPNFGVALIIIVCLLLSASLGYLAAI